jgi:Sap, sulfolipid-1-addressing protein
VSTWAELLLLALASMFWPTLIVIVVLALQIEHPIKILFWFLAGGLLTTIAVGCALVFTFQDASWMTGSSPSIDPIVDITIGLLSILGGWVLLQRRGRVGGAEPEPPPPVADDDKPKKPSITERAVESGAPVAFVSGIVLNIIPGTFPIVALKDIAQLDASNATKALTIAIFYVIMFAFVEIPIIGFLVAPERTRVAVNGFNLWLKRNGRAVAAWCLIGVGLYLLVRGLVEAL